MKSLLALILATITATSLITHPQSADQTDLEQVPRPMTPEEVKVWGPKFLEETKAKAAAKKAEGGSRQAAKTQSFAAQNSQVSHEGTKDTKNSHTANFSHKEHKEAQKEDSKILNSQFLISNSVFFTGKPFISETSAYAFRYRSYDPELNRWTSQDPSGFPDGANNSAYLAVPTWQFDWQGLQRAATGYVIAETWTSTFSWTNGYGGTLAAIAGYFAGGVPGALAMIGGAIASLGQLADWTYEGFTDPQFVYSDVPDSYVKGRESMVDATWYLDALDISSATTLIMFYWIYSYDISWILPKE